MELIELLQEKAHRYCSSTDGFTIIISRMLMTDDFDLIGKFSGSRKAKVSHLLSASGNITAKMVDKNSNDLAKVACVMVSRKLRALQEVSWLKALKVICNWLQLHPEELRDMGADSWTHFVSLVNLLPTESELSDINARNKKIAKELRGLFYMPLSEWEQEVSLPEDACVFDILKLRLHQRVITRRMSETAACFLRICCLRKYAHEFMRHAFTGLRIDNSTLKFVSQDSSNDDTTKLPLLLPMKSSVKLPLDNIAHDGDLQIRQSPGNSSTTHSRPTTFLIVDVLSLCSKLSFMKELVQSNQFTIVICISVTDQLHEWKAGMLSVRQAIAWIEYEWVHSNRCLMVRTSDSCSEKWEGELADVTLELVRMYELLIKKPPYPMHHVVLLTDYSCNSEEFKRIYAQAKEYSVEDIDVRNVGDFYAEWIKKEY
ncbi:Protein SMG5 [Trichuris trichiura]|uniref:Protein SMG5 n=1 Tax=Trichuris trichiura TaxID=36087 RepID=A0A077ZLK0_TRITR|nr:Protein SMG5 [Trichuris trichiura]